jgi:hypothetical protein
MLPFRQRCVVYQLAKDLSSRLAKLFVHELRRSGTDTSTIAANVYEIEVYHGCHICQDDFYPIFCGSEISRQKIERGADPLLDRISLLSALPLLGQWHIQYLQRALSYQQ